MSFEKIKNFPFVKFFCRFPRLLGAYHYCLAFLGALVYGFPSKKLIVIGVTGTKGKTTTCNLIAQILNVAGHKTGMTTTVNFRIGNEEWPNTTKQTMLGRFALQKMLRRMVDENCKYAVIETSSEGIIQYRHKFIDYKILVFTNLSPEHIERHGGFENYREAKVKLFAHAARQKGSVGIYLLDDENAKHFVEAKIGKKFGYYVNELAEDMHPDIEKFKIKNIKTSETKTEFDFGGSPSPFGLEPKGLGEHFEMSLIGEFNVYNAASAISVAISQNVPMTEIKNALRNAVAPSGRMEAVNCGQPFKVFVDYSYEPKSLEWALKTVQSFNPRRIIALIGSAGGGRDRWRRPVMGEIADRYVDIVVVTTDDPYDEHPETIINEIMPGALKNPARVLGENAFRIADRREAIEKALSLAEEGDIVLLSGKGGEAWMNVAGGRKIPWDEKKIAEEILGRMNK